MAKVLFRPFKPIKWLKFGLVALVVSLGLSGSGGLNFDLPLPKDIKVPEIRKYFAENTQPFLSATTNIHSIPMKDQIAQILEWIKTHLILIIILGIVAISVITIIWMILVYFSSRFTFIYLDGVVRNNIQIKRAYKENRINAWSYCLWRMLFTPHAVLFILLLTGIPATIILFKTVDKGFTLSTILLLVFIGLVLIGLCILLAIIGLFTIDFVVPIMYLMKIRIRKAWKVFLALLRCNKTQFSLYILMRIVLGLAALVVMIAPCYLLGCISIPFYLLITGLGSLALKYPLFWIGLIPLALIIWIIGSILWKTIISPITVFFRAYPLVFLEGFGDEFVSIRSFNPTVAPSDTK